MEPQPCRGVRETDVVNEDAGWLYVYVIVVCPSPDGSSLRPIPFSDWLMSLDSTLR